MYGLKNDLITMDLLNSKIHNIIIPNNDYIIYRLENDQKSKIQNIIDEFNKSNKIIFYYI